MRGSNFAFRYRRHSRVDPTRLVEDITTLVQDTIDAAMDGVISAADSVPFTVDDLRDYAKSAAECFRARSWREFAAWRDDDDPAEAMR